MIETIHVTDYRICSEAINLEILYYIVGEDLDRELVLPVTDFWQYILTKGISHSGPVSLHRETSITFGLLKANDLMEFEFNTPVARRYELLTGFLAAHCIKQALQGENKAA